jgi:hypothetical protein
LFINILAINKFLDSHKESVKYDFESFFKDNFRDVLRKVYELASNDTENSQVKKMGGIQKLKKK